MNITRGIIKRPQKVVLYGPEGIGKSTFASHFPAPLFLDVEGSTAQLDVARIGYCARCRKPFSLVGHRGIDRRFCSEACKTAAKNERTRNRRNALREAFLAGEGVAALAHRYYPDETAAAGGAKVRRELETWPKLKHEVDDAIEAEGWHAGLLARCRAEGLTVERLLSTRRREELKAMVARAHV